MESKRKKYLHNVLLGITVLGIYFVLPMFQALPLELAGINIQTMNASIKYFYSTCYEILMFGLILLVFNKTIMDDINDLKKNHETYFKKYFKYWLLALFVMMVSNGIIMSINGGIQSGNEEIIRELFDKNPLYIYITSVLIAPFVEELVFRKAIYYIIPKRIPFIIISGLIFGGLHVIGSATTLLDYLYLIPYCTPGFVFAYIMSKTENVLVSSSLHFMHNGILMSLQFLVLFFG